MPRGKGIYEDEPRDQLEGAQEKADAAQDGGAADAANTNEASGEPQEPPD